MALIVEFERLEKIYRAGDTVKGVVVVDSMDSLSFNRISMKVEGCVKPQLSPRSVGLFEAFYTSMKPITLMDFDIDVADAGRVPEGGAEFPFEFVLEGVEGKKLVETYHGVYVNAKYEVSVVMTRGAFAKDLACDDEFYVEVPNEEALAPEPHDFKVTPDALENVKAASVSAIPSFTVSGSIHKTNCLINKPFTGELKIEASEAEIKSIELQLVRVETVGYEGGSAREATEILNLQLVDGDVCRDLVIPMYLVFPRLFTCPTTHREGFSVEFEVNLIILFRGNYMVTENFPVRLYR